MKGYIKSSIQSGNIGIWWIYNDQIFVIAVLLDKGYDDGKYIHYHEYRYGGGYKDIHYVGNVCVEDT